MRTILAAVGLIMLVVLGSCGLVTGIAISKLPETTREATREATRQTKQAGRSAMEAYSEGRRKLEADRRFACWQAGDRKDCSKSW